LHALDARQHGASRDAYLHVARRRVFPGSTPMLDVIMLAIGLGFFALSVGYAYACDRL
jgi:hypothetical protein